MKIGYARVSTKDQNLDMQLDALKNVGCEGIFSEKESAGKQRTELEKMKTIMREGDTVVVWKLDRIGRSLKELINLIEEFRNNGISFISLNDPIDTTTSQGRLVFNIFASLAEFERELISERTKSALNAARARGRKGGRPVGLNDAARKKAKLAATLYKQNTVSIGDILKSIGISKTTFYRYLEYEGVPVNGFKKSGQI